MKDLLNDIQCANIKKKTIFFLPDNDDAKKTYILFYLNFEAIVSY